MTIDLDPIGATGTVHPVTLLPPDLPAGWVPPSYSDPTRPHRIQVAVSQIRPFAWLGELVHANVADGHAENLDGSASGSFSVPVTDPSLSLLCEDVEEWGDKTTGRLSLLNRQFHYVEDGVLSFQPLVCREPPSVGGGRVTFTLDAKTRLFEDRTHGKAQNTDLLNGYGNFPGVLPIEWLGWQAHGDLEVEEIDGARDGRGVRIRGNPVPRDGAPVGDHLSILKTLRVDETTGYNNIIRSTAFLKVPASARPDHLLMTVEVWTNGLSRYYPEPGDGFKEAAVVDEESSSDDWSTFTAKALLPPGPYSVQVYVKVYPTSETDWVEVDEVELIQRDNLSSGADVDLTHHLRLIIEDGQNEAKGKTSFGLPVVVGGLTGIEERLVIWREDAPPMTDAIEGVCGRDGGPDRPWVDIQGRARVEARRGSDRADLTLGPDQIVRAESWTVDPGSQVSEVRGLTDLGSDYYQHRAVYRDTTLTDGMLIERVERVPNGLGVRAADDWVRAEHAALSQPQETATFWVPIELGWTISVGDSFQAVWLEGGVPFGVRHDRTVRVIERAFHPALRLVALKVGAESDVNHRPALRRGWGTTFGRDRHAVGKGLVPSVGWQMREATAQPKRYRPPALQTFTLDGGAGQDGDFSGSIGSNSWNQDVDEGRWNVDAFTITDSTSTTGRLYLTIAATSQGTRAASVDAAGAGDGVSLTRTIHGPATVTVTTNAVLASSVPTSQQMWVDISRQTTSNALEPT